MRRTITDPAFSRRTIAIEADEVCELVVLDLDGRTHTFSPDVARRIGRGLLLVASIIDRPPLDHTIDPELDSDEMSDGG